MIASQRHSLTLAKFVLTGCLLAGCITDDSDVPIVEASSRFHDASVTWFSSEQMKYGLKDKNGKVILEPTYDDVRRFSEGLAAVNLGAEWVFPGVPDGGKWGYVDETGELKIPIQFQYANKFSDGLANVTNWSTGEGTMFIDKSGDIKIRIPDANAGDFREGLAPVYRSHSEQGQSWRTEYIDKSGETIFTVLGHGDEFYEGLAALGVRDSKSIHGQNSSYGFIDKSGKVVIKPQFAQALHFSNGLAAVRTYETTADAEWGCWGFIDRSGEFVIDPIFNDAKSFHDGKAMVHEGGEYILVEDADCYWEGGTWWLINKRGTKVGKIED